MKSLIEKFKNLSNMSKAAIVFVVCNVMQKVFVLISTPLFTRIMTTEEYGVYTVYQSWIILISIVTSFRLEYDVFNKGMLKFNTNQDNYISTMQTTTSFLTVILFIIYLLFNNVINKLTGLPTLVMLFMFVELFFTPPLSFWMSKERYNIKYKKVFIVTLSINIINFLFGVVGVLICSNKSIARIATHVLVNVVFGFIFYIFNYKKSNKIFDFKYAKYAILFNLPLLPHYLSSFLLSSSDKIMIQNLCGFEEAGIYGVIYGAALVINMVASGINNALIPWQYKKLESKKYKELNNKLYYFLFLFFILLIIFMSLAPEIMMVMAPKEYYNGIIVIPPVAASVYFIFLYNLICNVEFYYDKNIFATIISIISAILNVLLNYIFIQKYGYIAAGYTTLICYILVASFHLFYANIISYKNSGIKVYNSKVISFYSFLIVIFSIIISLFYHNIIIRYLFVIIILLLFLIKKNSILNKIKLNNQ